MLVSALDAETTGQGIEYACPRCDGVVAREDSVCPHCGQQLERECGISEWAESVAGEEGETPVPRASAEAVAARHVNPLSLLGVFLGVTVGVFLLIAAVLLALFALFVALAILVSIVKDGWDEYSAPILFTDVLAFGIAIGLWAAGVSLTRRSRRAFEGDRRPAG
jgi:hypothetical protein